ncbi:MAG: hypothetical protein NXI01_06745 [Gammaproteobacteria bacterium]|nr:hypothetical protein [Gammaproteobacteria bacterium]
MKKIAFILFFYSLQVLADDVRPTCPDYEMFEVIVKNNTTSDCVVVQEDLRHGYLPRITQFFSLKSNEEKKVSILYNLVVEGPDMALSYQCGTDKFVTIVSARDGLFAPTRYVKGLVSSAANMDAVFTAEQGSCEDNKPARIRWSLY